MAVAGAQPKPPALRMLTGNAVGNEVKQTLDPGKPKQKTSADAHKETGHKGMPEIQMRTDPLVPPCALNAAERKLWERFINPAWWLVETDVPKCHAWVVLEADFLKQKANATASMIAQLRALGSELGFDPAARVRLGALGSGAAKDEVDGFFDR